MNKLVSVIIPAFNSAQYLPETIESVLSQTYSNLEIILVDDGSTDDTRAFIEDLGDQVRYFYQENAGSARARNKGIREANGEYVAFLDSDDKWLPEKLVRQIDYLEKNNFDLVYCNKIWVDSCGSLIPDAYEQDAFPEGDIFVKMFSANYISTSSEVLAKKNILLDCGGFKDIPELRNCQDYELWLRISHSYQIGAIPEKLVKYRVHEANRTKDYKSRLIGMEACLRSALSLQRSKEVNKVDIKRRFFSLYVGFANSFFKSGFYKESAATYQKAFLIFPVKLSLKDYMKWIYVILKGILGSK